MFLVKRGGLTAIRGGKLPCCDTESDQSLSTPRRGLRAQTGFPQHPKEQLPGEPCQQSCQQSCWPQTELNNTINAWSPGGITRRESKDNNPSLGDRTLTPDFTWLQDPLTPLSCLPWMSPASLAFNLCNAWQQTPSLGFLIQNKNI